ncbi:hypothetical protein BGX33_008582 [Mortierella sp. NVP41]|nr:hypothetical protein BGX33_008582 [Mortierella sp. NVP41]
MSYAPIDLSSSKEDLMATVLQLQNRLQLLEDAQGSRDPDVFETPTSTTLKPLADNHDFFNISDYNLTDGMVYKAPAVLDYAEVKLNPAAKLHDDDLAKAQSRMAHHTRFYDHYANAIVKRDWGKSEQGIDMLKFLSTIRIAIANDAAILNGARSKLYYTALGIKHEPAKEGSILKVEEVAASKAASELIRSVYKKPEPPKAKIDNSRNGKQDSNKGGWKQSSSGSNDKSNDQQSFRKKKKQQSNGKKLSNSNSNSRSVSPPSCWMSIPIPTPIPIRTRTQGPLTTTSSRHRGAVMIPWSRLPTPADSFYNDLSTPNSRLEITKPRHLRRAHG